MRERPDPRERREPQLTYGELRRRLKEAGDPWTVDPTISDDEPVPQYPTGGQPPEEAKFAADVVVLEPDTDISELIAELPPANPALRRHWEEAGMPLDREIRAATSDRLPDEHGEQNRGGGER